MCLLLMKRRLDEGHLIQDIKNMIDCKCKEWINTKFEKYLRPNTLFGMNFDNYMEESKMIFNDVETPKRKFTINGYEDLINLCCQLCGNDDNTHIHHKSYTNRGRETFNDVVCLCVNCHKIFHEHAVKVVKS